MEMNKENLVMLKGKGEVKIDGQIYNPNMFYRCLVLENERYDYMVYGSKLTKEQYETNFKQVHQQIISDWITLGLIVNGKPISKTAFKKLASVHQYGNNNLRIIFFYIHPKELMYGFYPPIRGTKAKNLDSAYDRFVKTFEGWMDYIDNAVIQRGNSGIPIGYGDIYMKPTTFRMALTSIG